MVKLEVKDPQYKQSPIYFKTMEDCEAFKYVFQDHMCNVPWLPPVEADKFPEMTDGHRREMEKDPKKRAESDLSWGFYLVDRLNIGLTAEQHGFIKDIMDHLDNGGNNNG